MWSWPALLLAPLIALGELSLAYSMVSPACAGQQRGGLHAVAAVSLLVVLAMTALAWRDWRGHDTLERRGAVGESGAVTRADSDDAAQRPHFIALMAVIVGALSALVCVALWIPVWLLSPCY